MADIFLNLAAQSLGSIVGVQPLIAPLFAPAPQLVSDTALSASHNQPAVATEPNPFSVIPANFAEERIEQAEMEPSSGEIDPAERRAILPDLVPPDVPRNAISILPLRHQFQPRHLAHKRIEPLSPVSQALPPVLTSEEPAQPAHFPSPPLILPLPERAQEGALPGAISETTNMPPSFVNDDNYKQAQEDVSCAPQHLSPEDHQATSPGAAFLPQYVVPAAGSHVALVAAPSVLPTSLPLPQPLMQSGQSAKHDDVPDQQISSLAQPASVPETRPEPYTEEYRSSSEPAYQPSRRAGETNIEPLLADRPALSRESSLSHLAMPASAIQAPVMPVAVSAERVIAPVVLLARQEIQGEIANQDAHDRERVGGRQEEKISRRQAPGQPMPQNELPSALFAPKQETATEQEEEPSIRITIGRVVVRATATAQAAPVQKRVLRPAQSLGEYLKQRERGSR